MRLAMVAAIVVSASACGRLGFGSLGGDAGSGSDVADARVVDAPVYLLEAGQCPPGYDAYGTSCYRQVLANASWLAAEATCEGDAVGAHLAIVNDDPEAGLIQAVFEGDLWIGVSDRVTEGDYLDVTGAPLAYFDWDAGDPDGASEDCLAIDTFGEIFDEPCGTTLGFLCEYDGRTAVPSAYQ